MFIVSFNEDNIIDHLAFNPYVSGIHAFSAAFLTSKFGEMIPAHVQLRFHGRAIHVLDSQRNTTGRPGRPPPPHGYLIHYRGSCGHSGYRKNNCSQSRCQTTFDCGIKSSELRKLTQSGCQFIEIGLRFSGPGCLHSVNAVTGRLSGQLRQQKKEEVSCSCIYSPVHVYLTQYLIGRYHSIPLCLRMRSSLTLGDFL